MSRLKFSISLEIFKILKLFNLWALRELFPSGSLPPPLHVEASHRKTSGSKSLSLCSLAHQNRTIAIASDFRVDGAKSPEIPQKERVLGSDIAARNRKSLATFHCTLKSQCIIAFSCLGNRMISGVRDGHRNRKSQKSLRFRCAKLCSNFLKSDIEKSESAS